jgi:hypothetical protein
VSKEKQKIGRKRKRLLGESLPQDSMPVKNLKNLQKQLLLPFLTHLKWRSRYVA